MAKRFNFLQSILLLSSYTSPNVSAIYAGEPFDRNVAKFLRRVHFKIFQPCLPSNGSAAVM